MNNAQTSFIIKQLCKQKGVTITQMLTDTSIRKSLIYDMEKRDYTPSAEILEKIADYFNCSVDYLLGRVPGPDGTYYVKKRNTSINDKEDTDSSAEKNDDITEQFFNKFATLSFEEKIDAMQYVNKTYRVKKTKIYEE